MTKNDDTSNDNSSDKDSDEMLARITELARQAMAAQASFARQSLELGRATLSSEVDARAAGRAWVEAMAREGAHYWKEVGALGLDAAGSLVAIGSRSMARVISDTQAASRARPAKPSSGDEVDVAALGVVVADDDEHDVTLSADGGEERASVTLRGGRATRSPGPSPSPTPTPGPGACCSRRGGCSRTRAATSASTCRSTPRA